MPNADLPPSAPIHPLTARFALAQTLVREAGALANGYFSRIGTLTVKSKGSHDLVSEADVNTENVIRTRLAEHFSEDAFFGEESGPSALLSSHAPSQKPGGTSNQTPSRTPSQTPSRTPDETPGQAPDGIWVVDPIDGTQPFLSGLPSWCISIGFVWQGRIAFGVVYCPPTDELFAGGRGLPATVNGQPIVMHPGQTLADGLVSVGYSPRSSSEFLFHAMTKLLEHKGMFYRNGSGALSLCYVAAGRLLGYVEPHINSWDCLAAIAIIEAAGGKVSDFLGNFSNDPERVNHVLHHGNWLVASPATVYDVLLTLLAEKSGLPAK